MSSDIRSSDHFPSKMCSFISKCVNANKLPTKLNPTTINHAMHCCTFGHRSTQAGAGEGIKGVSHRAPRTITIKLVT
jgi:hypothetical protein